MANLTHLSEAQKAVLLLRKGLSPRASALRGDADYMQLLAHWRAEPEFRQLVRELAPMLSLRVIDVLEHAIILAPLGPDSVFAATLTDLRPGIGEMSRGALALVHIAIAATFFPTAVVLTGAQDDFAEVSATPARIAAVLREHCERLEAEAGGRSRSGGGGIGRGLARARPPAGCQTGWQPARGTEFTHRHGQACSEPALRARNGANPRYCGRQDLHTYTALQAAGA